MQLCITVYEKLASKMINCLKKKNALVNFLQLALNTDLLQNS